MNHPSASRRRRQPRGGLPGRGRVPGARAADGALVPYRGTGTGGLVAGTVVADTSGDGRGGLGRLTLYPGDGAGGFGTPQLIGRGWGAIRLAD